MKNFAYIGILCAVMSYGSTLEEMITLSEKNPSIKAALHQAKVYKSLHSAAQSENYPSLDISYGGTYLHEDPVMYLNSSFAGLPPGTEMQVQARNLYVGAVKLTYPLFTGFAVTAQIDKSKLRMKRASLEAEDAKRNLYINIVQAYTTALSLKHLIDSEQKAYEATQKSYDKAKAFFDLGMSSSAELYRIEANLNAIKAKQIQTDNGYKIALSQLSLMTKEKIMDVKVLPNIEELSLEKLTKQALQNRPDLQALRLMVKEQQSEIDLAKSSYYPSVALFAQASQVGDTLELDGDGYTNKDRSAAGFSINYNLFSGFKTQSQIEAAREAKLSVELSLQAYTQKIKTEIYESHLTYKSLLGAFEAAKAQVKAQEAYEKLVLGQFENQLADADTLSRAISSSAMSRASLISIDAKLYAAYAKALLQVDNKTFLNTIKSTKE
ncbi:MAG: TolC family protein [Campylobacterota bacterium]|nr:TolC family protein [Campylobacterota bacterium]